MQTQIIENSFYLFPSTNNCLEILQSREHVLIGISPFNSRFSDQYVEQLVRWAKEKFLNFSILLPSEEATSCLLEATGKTQVIAGRKTRHQLARNLKSIQRALTCAGVNHAEDRIVRFSDFHNHEGYNSILKQAEHLFSIHEEFKNACINMSTQAINGRLKAVSNENPVISEAQILTAVKYIFAEIPFFLNTPMLLGIPSSLLAYHRLWPIGEGIFSKRFPLSLNKNQGYLLLSTLQEYSGEYPITIYPKPTHLFKPRTLE